MPSSSVCLDTKVDSTKIIYSQGTPNDNDNNNDDDDDDDDYIINLQFSRDGLLVHWVRQDRG